MITAEILASLPTQPGVYCMKNEDGRIVYVGKAINIQKRLRSHCQRRDGHYASPFVEIVKSVDVIITDNDIEALVLEHTLIKKHDPPFNVKLKDDKRYPYLKVTTHEEFPRAFLTRTMESDGARYFGPYPQVSQARRILSALQEIFPMRPCKYDSDKLRQVRPCLDYEMGRCCAPCGNVVSVEEYQTVVRGVVDFIRGQHDMVLKTLQEKMLACSEAMLFEKAAFYRDILHAAEEFAKQQKMTQCAIDNQDFVGFARVHDIACVALIRRRGGRIVGSSHHFFDHITQADTQEILNAFLMQFYAQNTDIPKEIFLTANVGKERLYSLMRWLSEIAEKRVILKIPQRGIKHAMLQLADKNSLHYAGQQYRKLHGVKKTLPQNVIALQESLQLEVLPLRIEGYDISNTQGKEAVGAMVVFQDGKSQKASYRRFRIKGVDQINDYAMMQEMLRRRFQHGEGDHEEKKRFAEPPDLIMIDGGKGHLHAAMEVLDELDITHFPICSLAKQEEEVFLPGHPFPIRMDRRNPGLRLLQQVRDEAHRFGITYHRTLRGKQMKRSSLQDIPGIGPAKERILFKQFKTIEAIKNATLQELESTPGIPPSIAKKIEEHFK
jgi:excinuclease ABC subunit C